jgi:glucose-6-phosphate 1-epimerase
MTASAPPRPPQSLDELARDHSVDGARWEAGPGGLPMLMVRTEQCEARLFAHGAHVAAWTPAGQRPGLHLSPKSAFDAKKAIRGGVPVIFPWFGNRADDPFVDGDGPDGRPSPAHGFARTRPWQVERVSLEENGRVQVELVLVDDEWTRALWDAPFEATLTATLGQTLQVSLEVKNTGDAAFDLEEALHSYLEVGDVERVRVLGLEGTRYIDKTDGFKEKRTGRDPLVLRGETDSVFLGTKAAVTIDDPVLQRHVRIEKTGSQATVVWNPWLVKAQAMPDVGGEAWKSFLCVEAANVRPAPVPLPPGAVHMMTTRISVIPQVREE